MVREYKGSHSGEHGDGLVGPNFIATCLAMRWLTSLRPSRSGSIRLSFYPGKIVDPPKMDDRELFRFKPGYAPLAVAPVLDWSEWGGFAGAAEMCNNNGACRKADAGVCVRPIA